MDNETATPFLHEKSVFRESAIEGDEDYWAYYKILFSSERELIKFNNYCLNPYIKHVNKIIKYGELDGQKLNLSLEVK
jgi:hypothetical protein